MVRPFDAVALGAALLIPASLPAQDSRPDPALESRSADARIVDARSIEPQPSFPDRRYFDGVVAMIGDRAVLASTIKARVNAQIDGAYGAGRKVAPSDVEEFAREALQFQMHGEILAQSARTSTAISPEELKEIVQKEQQRFLDEEVSKAGSLNQYMRDLAAVGKTWETVAQEHENELLQNISVQDIYARTRQQFSLLVTPREMKRYYDGKRNDYVQLAAADVERVIFSGEEAGKSAQVRAQAAALAWRAAPQLDAEALARSFSGTALPTRKGVRDEANDANAPFIRTFAATATAGSVSEPIGVAQTFWVLRIAAKTAAKNQGFGEPAVQRGIVNQLVREKQVDQERQLVLRNHRNLYVFPFDLLDR